MKELANGKHMESDYFPRTLKFKMQKLAIYLPSQFARCIEGALREQHPVLESCIESIYGRQRGVLLHYH
jgi:hypothetical protein